MSPSTANRSVAGAACCTEVTSLARGSTGAAIELAIITARQNRAMFMGRTFLVGEGAGGDRLAAPPPRWLPRQRSDRNAARMIDLDLLDFRGKTAAGGPGQAILPHPRMTARAFVLRPLADLAPAWRHPVSGTPIHALLAALPADQVIEKL